jgi:adhesin transport system membrane fusion protein
MSGSMQEKEAKKVAQDELDFITNARAAVLEQTPQGARRLIWLVTIFVFLAILWSNLAELDIVVKGQGKVIPVSQIQVVQNLEGGIVEEIFVREGDIVQAGQVLLRIDDTRFNSSLREDEIKRYSLQLKGLRLKAESEGASAYPEIAAEIKNRVPELTQQEEVLFNQRQAEQNSKRDIISEQVKQKEHQVNELKTKQSSLRGSLGLASRELKLTKPLQAQGAVSEVEVLQLERRVNDLRGEIDQLSLSIPRAESEKEEAMRKLDEVNLTFQQEAQTEYNKVVAELSTLREASVALEDRVARTLVRAPLKGTVKSILINTVGGVVQPGMDLVEIVPMDEGLLVEARVLPKDIAFIRPELNATIKLTAYDFGIYGGLKGQVKHISADSFVDEKENPYYLVRVLTRENYLEYKGEQLPIIPGMTAEVDILAGKRTVFDYIMKPILKAKQSAMQEM